MRFLLDSVILIDHFNNIEAATNYLQQNWEEIAISDNKIAVEIKSFIGVSAITEFHLAHGQFMDYRYALEEETPERKLYLAVPLNVYKTFFSLQFIQTVVQRSQISLLIYDPDREVILQWQL